MEFGLINYTERCDAINIERVWITNDTKTKPILLSSPECRFPIHIIRMMTQDEAMIYVKARNNGHLLSSYKSARIDLLTAQNVIESTDDIERLIRLFMLHYDYSEKFMNKLRDVYEDYILSGMTTLEFLSTILSRPACNILVLFIVKHPEFIDIRRYPDDIMTSMVTRSMYVNMRDDDLQYLIDNFGDVIPRVTDVQLTLSHVMTLDQYGMWNPTMIVSSGAKLPEGALEFMRSQRPQLHIIAIVDMLTMHRESDMTELCEVASELCIDASIHPVVPELTIHTKNLNILRNLLERGMRVEFKHMQNAVMLLDVEWYLTLYDMVSSQLDHQLTSFIDVSRLMAISNCNQALRLVSMPHHYVSARELTMTTNRIIDSEGMKCAISIVDTFIMRSPYVTDVRYCLSLPINIYVRMCQLLNTSHIIIPNITSIEGKSDTSSMNIPRRPDIMSNTTQYIVERISREELTTFISILRLNGYEMMANQIN